LEINSGGCLYKDTEEDPWQAILEMLNLFCSLILSKNLGTCMHFKTKEKIHKLIYFFIIITLWFPWQRCSYYSNRWNWLLLYLSGLGWLCYCPDQRFWSILCIWNRSGVPWTCAGNVKSQAKTIYWQRLLWN